MAGASLFTLLDDIALILDDVSVLTKIAAKKTAGVLGDDLALNAQQVSGVAADRELPIVWKVAKGSTINKAILVPSALVISIFLPPLVGILLVIGGLYLCYEGIESVFHKLFHLRDKKEKSVSVMSEEQKIKGAVRTDFVLSAEIIVITLGTVAAEPLMKQISVLLLMSIIMTIGVYGLVAVIVKLDDLGLYLTTSSQFFLSKIGKGILIFAPQLMKSLSFIGTVAMFLVGGGIIAHAIPQLHNLNDIFVMAEYLINFVVGVLAGIAVFGIVNLASKLRQKFNPA